MIRLSQAGRASLVDSKYFLCLFFFALWICLVSWSQSGRCLFRFSLLGWEMGKHGVIFRVYLRLFIAIFVLEIIIHFLSFSSIHSLESGAVYYACGTYFVYYTDFTNTRKEKCFFESWCMWYGNRPSARPH